MFTPNLGEMIQFDEHIFQTGGEKPPTSWDLSSDAPEENLSDDFFDFSFNSKSMTKK